MLNWLILLMVFLSTTIDSANGRLTEIQTERIPVLVQNLHKVGVDLKAISKRALLGPRSQFQLKNGDLYQTAKGSQRVRLIQIYANYEVYGPTAVAELDIRGHFTGHLYGQIARNLHKDIPNPEACVKDIKLLQNIAIRLEKLKPTNPNIDKRDGRRVIYASPNKRTARIVYVVEFFYNGGSLVSRPVYYFDACSQSVLFSYDDIRNISISQTTTVNQTDYSLSKHPKRQSIKLNPEISNGLTKVRAGCEPSVTGRGGNDKIGRIFYGSPPFCLPVQQTRNRCRLDGDYFRVIDNKNSRETNRDTTVSFRCRSSYRDPVNGAYGIANDAQFYGEVTGRIFHTFFGQRALPSKPRIVVHFGSEYENAFWTGGDMYFGDGKDLFYPLVSLDIVAHEYAHGFTRRHSDLIYRGQPGGINEAYSDISAVATRSLATGKNVWELGADVTKSRRGAIRYVNNPPKDGRSIKNILFYRPFMNVHHSSGIYNFAFYKMVTSFRFSVQDAYASFFIANKLLWGKFTRFRAGACNVLQASYDAGTNFNVVRKSFAFTGIPLIFCRKRGRGLITTLFPGEKRENILVSLNRSPIIEINMEYWTGVGVEASTDAYSGIIHIVVATDEDADYVIAKGDNYVRFPTNHTRVHVKLMSDYKTDAKVTLKVLD